MIDPFSDHNEVRKAIRTLVLQSPGVTADVTARRTVWGIRADDMPLPGISLFELSGASVGDTHDGDAQIHEMPVQITIAARKDSEVAELAAAIYHYLNNTDRDKFDRITARRRTSFTDPVNNSNIKILDVTFTYHQ